MWNMSAREVFVPVPTFMESLNSAVTTVVLTPFCTIVGSMKMCSTYRSKYPKMVTRHDLLEAGRRR